MVPFRRFKCYSHKWKRHCGKFALRVFFCETNLDYFSFFLFFQTKAAYVLFYQRREDTSANHAASNSVNGARMNGDASSEEDMDLS